MNITELGARALAARIAAGELSAAEACEACLAAVAAHDGTLAAFRHVAVDRARQRAEALDAARARGETLGPLHGVPVAVKDNICTRDLPTTAASRILDGFIPPYDATAVARLEAAGANVIGKTNLDEFGMGSSTENSAYGASRNPWDPARAPGGSSGGSAVAVAARMAPLALGTDTGGSIRQPAAFCGITGLKPTYGRVSRYGLLAFASSLDQVGSLTRTVEDAALALGVMAGSDPHDATASDAPVDNYLGALTGSVDGLRIGVPRSVFTEGVDAGVDAALEAALDVLRAHGATVVDIDLPHTEYAVPVYYLVATAEASSNLARYDGVRYGHRAAVGRTGTLRDMYDKSRDEGFGAEVKRRIMLGTYVLSAGYYDAFYLKAQQVRTLLRRDYEQAFERVDIVAMPTAPTPAFRLGEKTGDPLQMYLADVFTVSANLAGLPALSVPCGMSAESLPIGMQLTGRPFDEATLLRAADAYQRRTSWHLAVPAGSTAPAA